MNNAKADIQSALEKSIKQNIGFKLARTFTKNADKKAAVGKLDQSALDTFDVEKTKLERQLRNANEELAKQKQTITQLKQERADLDAKL